MKFIPESCTDKILIPAAALLILVLIISCIAIVAINGSFITAPELTVEDIDISKITINETGLNVILLVDNKNIFGGTLKDLSFDIIWNDEGENHLIAHGEKDLIKIDGNQKKRVTVPLDFYNKNLIPLAAGTLTKGSLNMTLKGSADIEFLFLSFNVPFEENRTIETGIADIIGAILKFIN